MFTGIIEGTAKVTSATDGTMFRRLLIAARWSDVKLGDSIAINGVCLTVSEISASSVGFDVIKETLDKTNLGTLQPGDEVNVERSLRAGDRIDGHFVQGHIDGTGELVDQVKSESEVRLTISAPPPVGKFLTPKGSISIDGVSLTIASVRGNIFEVALIPTTLRLTNLGSRSIGWRFNLEADVLSKTIVHYLEMRGVASPPPSA
jgi:riboflavin synthase